MSYVPLGIFTGLAAGDYGLWKWSLAGNHQVLAVVFGLALLPLALAAVCLLVVNAWRLCSDFSRSRKAQGARRDGPRATPHRGAPTTGRARRASRRLIVRARRRPGGATAAGQAERPAGKLVA